MSYADAMHDYGSDKPDLRIDLKLVDITDLMKAVEFKVFSGPANDPKGRIAALRLPGGGDLSRKEIDDYTGYVSIFGARGLAWIKVNDIDAGVAGLQSPILKFMPEDVVAQMMTRLEAANGDIIKVQIDYAQSKERIPSTIEKMGSEILEIEEVGGSEWNIFIKVVK